MPPMATLRVPIESRPPPCARMPEATPATDHGLAKKRTIWDTAKKQAIRSEIHQMSFLDRALDDNLEAGIFGVAEKNADDCLWHSSTYQLSPPPRVVPGVVR